ncbi:MAG: ShlB/FhaC/HecB family hemolysin secretion/activation protein [Candidatus Omnitrophica bacterium]|nr:ShlB/FhaC/HecB family hemolysin secretion/activation protein [Candidatus Omnitrophota bacterium]MDD5487986.1 ShlB/FhaC/HecB family hemolysin secretion/activation protein [Candidatus Omnitrophota bacterium]
MSTLVYRACFSQPLPSESTIDMATREVDRPFREEAEEKLTTTPPQAPEKIEEEEKAIPQGPTFLLKEVVLEGTETFPPDEFTPLFADSIGKDTDLAELTEITKNIEKEYLKKGVIAACFLPPQDIKNGVVTLRVVEAKMGELKIQSRDPNQVDRVKYYWDIKPGQVLRYDKMSRSLQLMNKNPDRDVKATLIAGQEIGTTDVMLDTTSYFPIHGFFSYDNEGAPSTGGDRYGFGVRHNNALFVDDTFLSGYTFGQYFSGMYMYHSVPITNFGTNIIYGYSDSRSAPRKQFSVYGIRSRSQSASFTVSQDLYKRSEYLGDISLGMDSNDKVTTTEEGTLIRDRFRTARLKSNIISRNPGAITYISPQLSQGLNAFGARRKHPLSSRNGTAGNTFTKFNLDIKHRQLFPASLQAALNIKTQFSGEKLASQEQLSLGGIDSIRGYPAQDYMADNGFIMNLDLLVPCPFIPESWKLPYAQDSLRNNVNLLCFMDYGYGEKRAARKDEERQHVNYSSIGAGLRIRLYNQALLRLEWGFPIGPDKATTESPNPRFHFALTFEENLPKEWERIKSMRSETPREGLPDMLSGTPSANELLDNNILTIRRKETDPLTVPTT